MPWSRRDPGPSADLLPAVRAREGAVAVFLTAEVLFTEVDTAAEALGVLHPGHPALGPWPGLRAQYLEASAAYVNATTQFDLDQVPGRPAPGYVHHAAQAYGYAHHVLDRAIINLTGFRDRNGADLFSAAATAKATPQAVQGARAAARQAREAAAQSGFGGHLGVRRAVAELDAGLARLDDAAGRGDIRGARDTAIEVRAQAKAVAAAVEDAPRSAQKATAALAAVRTRIDAVAARVEVARQAHSALLREFSARCSDDLAGAEARALQARDQAEAAWGKARAQLSENLPDHALEAIGQARELLGAADKGLGAVTARLALLRSVRADPSAAADKVLFTIRDARHLVRDRGVANEWGSVLDAQQSRVRRAQEALGGNHPDFWAYLRQLDAVDVFVADIINRVRGRDKDSGGARSPAAG